MKKAAIAAILSAALLSGCASNKKAETKPIFERPWVGGHFEKVPTPALVRTQKNRDLLELRDPKSKYLQELAAWEDKPQNQNGSPGLHSDEGWKCWLGPFALEHRRTILSQE